MKWIPVYVSSALALAAALTSCGNTVGSVQTYNCCLDQQYYECPDLTTFTACFNNRDHSGCEAKASKNIGCQPPP